MSELGQIVILNGAPRSGKSSIVAAIQETFDGPWMNLGADAFVRCITPERYRPGVGLRPGGERADLEPYVAKFFAAMYESIAVHSRLGLNFVVDIGHHESYAQPWSNFVQCAKRLEGLPVLFVGVHCPIEVIMARRNAGQEGREGQYVVGTPLDPIPAPVLAWQEEVHRGHYYDLELDTSQMTPHECAEAIKNRLATL